MQSVQEQIQVLVKLQAVDSRIYALRQEKAGKPELKEELEESFTQKGRTLKAKEEESKTIQLKKKEHELDLETKEKEIKKFQSQLVQLKTNKEYVALQKEIEGRKADNSTLEDNIIGLMDKIDLIKAEITREREALAAAEKSLKEELARIDQEIADLDKNITEAEQERSEISTQIEKNLLRQYERILKAKDGLAFVPVVGESCGGCNQILPPQVINEVRMKDRVVTCELCARLLYWPQ
ncbi:MAG: C4-type zinc ribbon domain-containing protein [Candidatus Omnitrophota bacterium]